ncbi:MAG: FAD-dependent oxidoreductase [Methanocorpusculum sp.]|nr:FAD-dependent oxidoreductase [Methanocorpusculum sp.]
MKTFDAIIIGFGKGGKTLAGKLASSGKTVALIEKSDRMYGGTCINVGCIPSKSLVNSAAFSARQPGLSFEDKAKLYTAAITEKRRVTAMLRQKNFDKLNQMKNVTIFNGTGSFISKTEVRVENGTGIEIVSAPSVYINTGSKPMIPDIKGLADCKIAYFSETMMELDTLPKELVILGGGYIGLEFASMYASFGSHVTVLQDGAVFLPKEDEDIAAEIKKVLEAKGIAFYIGAAIHEISAPVISFAHEGKEYSIKADAILVAAGRTANIDGLNLRAAGVEVNKRGIVVDEHRRTSAENIFAMGDVCGGLQFTYVSLDDFRVIWSGLTGGTYSANERKNVPYSVFIDPPFSRVGMNEREARAAGHTITVANLPAGAVPKAQVLRKPEGMLKAVIDADTKKILGAMLFCSESYEIINIVKLAMDAGVDYTVLRDQIFTHPTMAESLNDLFA